MITRIHLFLSTLLLGIPAVHIQAEDSVPGLFIEGYTGLVIYAPGERVGFPISTSAAEFSVKIGRAEAKREVVWEKQNIPGKDTKILLQLATNTYNAYNNWGHSLRLCVPVRETRLDLLEKKLRCGV